jgi:hypothetical protein
MIVADQWFLSGITQSGWGYFNPAQVADQNWRIVGATDFNADVQPDLVWQNRSTGQIGVWFMSGVNLSSVTLFTPGQVTDTNWRLTQVWNLVTEPILPVVAKGSVLRSHLPLLALGLIAPVILYFRQKAG